MMKSTTYFHLLFLNLVTINYGLLTFFFFLKTLKIRRSHLFLQILDSLSVNPEDWVTLGQGWNQKLQNNFENYLECRPVTLDELKTRIAAEIGDK